MRNSANEIPQWSEFTGNCFMCHRDFHISKQSLDDCRESYPGEDDAAVAKHFEICLSCIIGRDLAGEHDFPLPMLTEAHLAALGACLDVADPDEDDGMDGGPASLHKLATEALALLRKGAVPKSKKGTIIVVLHQGQVQDVQTDLTGEDLPTVYTLDYDTDGNTDSECLIDHTYPLSSLVDGPTATAPALCYEWPLDDPDPAAIARLESALAESHNTHGKEIEDGKVYYPADTAELNDAIDAHVTRTNDPVADAWNRGENKYRTEVLGQAALPLPVGRLEKHRAAHGHAGTAHRIENDGGLTL